MKKRMTIRWMVLLCGLFLTGMLQAQQLTVTGTVSDAADGFPLQGVTILEKGTSNGTITDMSGNFTLNVDRGATLVISFVGYITQEQAVTGSGPYNVKLVFDEKALDEVVVIGYGTVKKEDATGSVAVIGVDDFNKGAISTPTELISGKIAGVQITTDGGAPGAGATIRIRGGSSLSASNDPLIVIDGVPVDNAGISGMRNPLSTINPNDIATFNVLKDASATAIYGSRASNGVIIITTKKGNLNRPMKVGYDGYVSLSTPGKKFDIFDADEFRNVIQDQYAGNNAVLDLLGDANTDWFGEIFRNSISHDHNLSLTGGFKNIPYRFSVGYSDQNGILKNTSMERVTGSINLSPTFLDDHLSVNLNLKGMTNNNQFGDQGAIGNAARFDPTQPVKDPESPYGGFFTWTDINGNPNDLAPTNPVALLEMKKDVSTVNRVLGNLQLDYKFHFLPDLHANLNMAYDYSESNGTVDIPENAAFAYDALNGGGEAREYSQSKKNELLDFYLNYKKDYGAPGRVDLTLGYSWQHFWRQGNTYSQNISGSIINTDTDYETENYLVSFFGRMNYVFRDKYLLTFTLRQDGSSRFSPDTRWGLFPSVALAWNMADEEFFPLKNVMNVFKLRLGYGITGQQDITDNDYPYLARYTASEPNARYPFGNQWITTYRPEGYDANLKWEETTTYNIGLDYGMLENRIFGELDFYYRETADLINTIPVPAGTNMTNQILTNVGNLTNQGVEFSINGKAISRSDVSWEVGLNATFNKNEITKLTAVDDPTYQGVYVGGISGGVGNTIQIHTVGYPAYSFYVWQQVYDDNGKPIEGLYVDRDKDGLITVDDRYRLKKAAPDVFLGISSNLVYKNWDFSFSGRASIGNWVYNNNFSGAGTFWFYQPTGFLSNQTTNVLETGFVNANYFSDYFVENGSFFRMDYMTLGYSFDNLPLGMSNFRIYGTVQNFMLLTKYRGIDPEMQSGIDNNLYPRPTVFMLGVNVDF